MVYERAVALKVNIEIIHKGQFHKSEEEYAPSYIEVDGKKISRVNVVGSIVKKEGSEAIIDDGTGDVSIIAFNNELNDVNEGDVVMVIGKIRERDNERNIYIETLKKVGREYLKLRRLETERMGFKDKEGGLPEIEEMDVIT